MGSFYIRETNDIEACRRLRLTVFVKEQGVPLAEEIDDLDEVSTHYLVFNSNGDTIGTARVFEKGKIGKIGRVCILEEHRGGGIGANLIRHCMNELRQRPHLASVQLGAQEQAISFYEKLGFVPFGERYMDGGIPHFDMEFKFDR